MERSQKLNEAISVMFTAREYADDYLYYAHLLAQTTIKIEQSLPAPAAVCFDTDHYVTYINPKIFDGYELVERLAILKHEMLHIMYGHLERTPDGAVPIVWNLATDCALNQDINRAHLPKGAILPKRGWPLKQTAEYYYELFKQEQDQKQDQNDGQKQDQEGGERSGVMDVHEYWGRGCSETELMDSVTRKMIESAREETIKSIGKAPKKCSAWLEIHTNAPQISWKQVLRSIVSNKKVGRRTTIMKRSRRFPKREEIRGTVKDRRFDVLIVADVSGSMSDKAVMSTLNEVKQICEMTKTSLDLIQVDTEAHAPEKVTKSLKLFNRKGFGGTYLSNALEMAEKHKLQYDAVVVITDGYLMSSDVEEFNKLRQKVVLLIEEDGIIPRDLGKITAVKMVK